MLIGMNRTSQLLVAFVVSCSVCLAEPNLSPAAKADIDRATQKIVQAPTAINYSERARLYFINKLFHESEADASRAIALDPQHAHAWMTRGGARCNMGLYKEGLEDLNKAISLAKYGDSVYVGALTERVYCYINLHLKQKAYADAKVLVELGAAPASRLDDPDLH